MSLSCGFFNSEDGDRQYFNQDLSNFLEGLITDGVYEFIGDKMMLASEHTINPLSDDSMNVFVRSGRAWFNGTWTKIDTAYSVTIPASDPVLNRIDAICLTVNLNRAVRDNYIEIISGTGANGTPTKPTVQDEVDIYRHVLAYVTVGKGVTAITQANIENRVGMGSALFSAPKWGDVPSTEEMVAQWQAQFDEFMDHIHETFDYDAAGHLQNEIDDLSTAISNEATTRSTDIETLRRDFTDGCNAIANALIAQGVTPAKAGNNYTPQELYDGIFYLVRNLNQPPEENTPSIKIVCSVTMKWQSDMSGSSMGQKRTYTANIKIYKYPYANSPDFSDSIVTWTATYSGNKLTQLGDIINPVIEQAGNFPVDPNLNRANYDTGFDFLKAEISQLSDGNIAIPIWHNHTNPADIAAKISDGSVGNIINYSQYYRTTYLSGRSSMELVPDTSSYSKYARTINVYVNTCGRMPGTWPQSVEFTFVDSSNVPSSSTWTDTVTKYVTPH